MDAQRMAEISSALGIGFLGRLGVRELTKLIPVPGVGSGVSALYAAASTYGLGAALCEYFSRVRGGDMPDVRIIRRLYAEEFQRGQRWLAQRMGLRPAAEEEQP